MTLKKDITCPLMQAAQRLFGYQPSVQEETRWRVLQAAMEVFSEVGYHAATTRAICSRAGVNLASIHYHFGDKAELYREVFRLPFLQRTAKLAHTEIADIPLPEMLHEFYDGIYPLPREQDPIRYFFMRLHAREEAEPSGVLGDALAQAIRPNHDKLEAILCRELGLKKPDVEVHRLAFSLVGMAMIYAHGGSSVVESFAPQLLNGKHARGVMLERLVAYASALIGCERKRRAVLEKEKK